GGTDRRRRARLHLRRRGSGPVPHGRPSLTPDRTHRARFQREPRRQDSRDGSPEPLQTSDAPDCKAELAHCWSRLSLSKRLGSGLSESAKTAGPTEGPRATGSRLRRPEPGGPRREERVSVGPAPMRVGLGYTFALTAAAFFGVGGIIAKAAFNSGVQPSILAEWRVLFAFLVFLSIFAALRFDLR